MSLPPRIAVHFGMTLAGAAVLKLWLSGKLDLYVHPATVWFVGAASLVLLAIASSMMVSGIDHLHLSRKQIGMTLLVVFLLFVGRNLPLSVEMASRRQVGDESPLASRRTISLSGTTIDFDVLEWAVAWESDPTHRRYLGSEADVTGFILHERGTWYVTRMLLTCCAVDAQPVQLAFETEKVDWPEGTWVRVKGVIREKDGSPVIHAVAVEEVGEPESPYVY